MGKRMGIAAAVLALLAFGLLYFGGRRQAENAPAAATAANTDRERAAVPRPQMAAAGGAVAEPEAVARPNWPQGSLPGQAVLRVPQGHALADWLAAAAAAGLEVGGVIEPLGLARVYGSLRDITAFAGESGIAGYNYAVGIPLPPSDVALDGGNLVGFGDGALRFMGVLDPALTADWGHGVVIAVLDTGVEAIAGIGGAGIRSIDLLGGQATDGELGGHATAVASLISADNEYVTGLARGSELLSVRVLDGDGNGDSFTLAEGIVRAVNAGADVLNLSLGSAGDSAVLREAVEYARARGVVLVAAVGNDGASSVRYPAAYDGVIAVGAVDAAGNMAEFSNRGAEVDIVAPGAQVYSVWDAQSIVNFNGTSAATALVSAAAARIVQTGLASGDAVGEILRQNANERGYPGVDSAYGAGIIDVGRVENSATPGVIDIALADLYPATEEAAGGNFPLYITVQNRGTASLSGTQVELSIDGSPYYYRFADLEPGEVGTLQVPVSVAQVQSGSGFVIEAEVNAVPGDARPANNAGKITLGFDETPTTADGGNP